MHSIFEVLARIINILLTPVRYIIDICKPSKTIDDLIKEAEDETPANEKYPYAPFSGQAQTERLEAEAAILFEDDRIVLTVEYNFKDVPSWVEGDASTRNISVMMMGGGTVVLQLPLPANETERLQTTKYMVFVTGTESKKLMHNISFIYKG